MAVAIVSTADRIYDRVVELATEGGIIARDHVADLTDPVAVAVLLEACDGPVDVLVNNAGMGSIGAPSVSHAFVDQSPADWTRIGSDLNKCRTYYPCLSSWHD